MDTSFGTLRCAKATPPPREECCETGLCRPGFAVRIALLVSARRADQSQSRDLGRRTEALGWAPVTRPPAHVNPELPQPVQPGRERLLQRDEVVPWPELSSMRMAGELHVESRVNGRESRARLVRKQDAYQRVVRRVPKRFRRIALLPRIEVMRTEVRHSGEDNPCAALLDHDVLV